MGKSLIELKIKNYYREDEKNLGPCYVNNNYNYLISKKKINNNMVQSSTDYYRDNIKIENFEKELNLYFLQQYSVYLKKKDYYGIIDDGIIEIDNSKVDLNHIFIENYDDIHFSNYSVHSIMYLYINDSKIYNINSNNIFNHVYINRSSIEQPLKIKTRELKLYRISDFKEITIQSGVFNVNLDIDINYKDPQYLLNNIKVEGDNDYRVYQVVLRNLVDKAFPNKHIEITKEIISNLALNGAQIVLLNFNKKDELNLDFEELYFDHLKTSLDKGENNEGRINLYIKNAYIQNNYCSHRCTKCNFFIENLYLNNSEEKLYIDKWNSCRLEIKNVYSYNSKLTSFKAKTNTKNTNVIIYQGKTYNF